MLVDMFGIPLAVGQHVFYADNGAEDERPELSVYRIVEIEEPNVIIGEQLNGEVIGNWFYLSDPVKRVAVIGGKREMFLMAECYKGTIVN